MTRDLVVLLLRICVACMLVIAGFAPAQLDSNWRVRLIAQAAFFLLLSYLVF